MVHASTHKPLGQVAQTTLRHLKNVHPNPMVAHILGAVFDPKTSILGSPGVILAPLGSILVALGSPGDPRGDPLGSKVDLDRFGEFLPAIWVPILVHFRTTIKKTATGVEK